jgi:hypothetical protein
VKGAETRAVFAYDERLRLLPDYLQQLEMESNGKSVKIDGSPLDGPTAAITWGGVGTDAQHAVFQLLHQGTRLVPVEFIAAIEPEHVLDEAHHRTLLVNCFAQGAALMAGRPNDDPARAYAGNRPSTTILLDRLDPARLGALIAFYEQRTFANAVPVRRGTGQGDRQVDRERGYRALRPLDPRVDRKGAGVGARPLTPNRHSSESWNLRRLLPLAILPSPEMPACAGMTERGKGGITGRDR